MRDEGIEALKAAHELDPEDVDTHLKLGEIYLRDDSALDEAEDILKKAHADGMDTNIPASMLGQFPLPSSASSGSKSEKHVSFL